MYCNVCLCITCMCCLFVVSCSLRIASSRVSWRNPMQEACFSLFLQSCNHYYMHVLFIILHASIAYFTVCFQGLWSSAWALLKMCMFAATSRLSATCSICASAIAMACLCLVCIECVWYCKIIWVHHYYDLQGEKGSVKIYALFIAKALCFGALFQACSCIMSMCVCVCDNVCVCVFVCLPTSVNAYYSICINVFAVYVNFRWWLQLGMMARVMPSRRELALFTF